MSEASFPAADLESIFISEKVHANKAKRIAAELRRMHAENEALRAQQDAQPFGHATVQRLSQRFENHTDSYFFYPAGQSPYMDNVDECHAVYTHPAPKQVQPSEVGMTFPQINMAAKVLAERMDYPWSQMPQQGRDKMREIAQSVIEAAHGITGDKL